MKRLIPVFFLGTMASLALAQVPFTISRPADGSRVREVVHIKIPKASVPPGGYVGFYAEGKFIEATILPTDSTGKFYVYDLDTQKKKLADGPLKIEAVLFENYQDAPRIINRSSVEVTLQNSAASMLPPGGIYLRYNWTPGKQYIYDVTESSRVEEGTDANSTLGGRATSQSKDTETYRQSFEVDDQYGNGDGLVRSQLLPNKGKHSLFISTNLSPAPEYLNENTALAVYQRLTNTGLERWGGVPFATPIQGTSGTSQTDYLLGINPLPSLPFKKVLPGSSWAARFQEPTLDLNHLFESKTIVEHFPARGEFVDVEWKDGHPCARIENTIEQGTTSDEEKAMKKDAQQGDITGAKLQVKETFWFALDKRAVVEYQLEKTVDVKTQFSSGFGGGGSPGPGAPGTPGTPGGAGAPSMNGAGGTGGSADLQIPSNVPKTPIDQFGPRKGGGKPSFGGPGAFGGSGRPGSNRGGAPSQSGFIRQTSIITLILEK